MRSEDVYVLDPESSLSTSADAIEVVAEGLERCAFLPERVDAGNVRLRLESALRVARGSPLKGPFVRIRLFRSGRWSAGGFESVEQRFSRLAQEWRRETEMLSSITQKSTHRAYQNIIGLGRDALPCILRELERQPDHWFWALKAITGVDPVPVEHRGKLVEMAKDWIDWARAEGIRW